MGAYGSGGNSEFFLSISQSDNPGYLDYSAYGLNMDIDTATVPEDIWYNGTVFVSPTTYRKHNFSSSSANDTSAGTGMRTCRIYGVVSTGLANEVVTLNGVGAVATVNDYSDIYLVEGLTWGSGLMNTGNISAVAQVDGTTTAYIPALQNATKKAIRLIPPGYTGYLYDFQAGMQQATASSFAEVYMMKKVGTGWIPIRYHALTNSGNTVEIDEFLVPVKLDAGTWVKIQCTNVTNNNTLVQGAFNLIIKANG